VTSREKNLDININSEWLEPKLRNGVCEVTGIPFTLDGKHGPFMPSLDRIDPKKGYTKDNVQVVILMHNSARMYWGDTPLVTYARSIIKQFTNDILLRRDSYVKVMEQ